LLQRIRSATAYRLCLFSFFLGFNRWLRRQVLAVERKVAQAKIEQLQMEIG
jgi:hypothetical protein